MKKLKRKQTVVAVVIALTGHSALAQFDATLNLADLNGTNGFSINGVNSSDFSGISVSSAGDVNGDGIDDVIIGALFADPNGNSAAGSSYVVFGNDAGLPNPLNLADLDGSNGFTINGVNDDDLSGGSVSKAGDVNGDGIDDLIIGALFADPNGNSAAGSSYVVFGNDAGLSNPLNLADLDGNNGFTFNGLFPDDRSGVSVSSAGDVNGDGIDDLIIGAFNAFQAIGVCYVVFGSDTGFPNPMTSADLGGTSGMFIGGVNESDSTGFSVSSAGDVNGDGIDDLIIGAYRASPNINGVAAGSSYVVFGSDDGLPSNLDLGDLDGTNGFSINGVNSSDFSGISVSSAGDVNGDGIDDVIIGAINVSPNGNVGAGSSYVVFGNDVGFPNPLNLADLDGTNGFTINGVNESDSSGRSVSHAGDVNGDGIDDVIIGAINASPNGNAGAGSSYVVFGSDAGFPNPLNLADLDGTNGFTINGVNGSDSTGRSVSRAGDVNGDGIDDVIIGAAGADPGGILDAGSSYVVFGSDLIFHDGFESD